jgi:hypothetical protein
VGARREERFRDRQVIVDEWAFKIIMAYVKATPMHPDALLFGEITEDTHRARWYEVRDALRAKGVNIPAELQAAQLPQHVRGAGAKRRA